MYKTLGVMWLHECFCLGSAYVSADSDDARNPQRFIYVTVIAYYNNRPVGWCSVSPRERFSALERSRILKRIDEKPVGSIVCFFIAKPYRKNGLTRELLNFAIKYCTEQGAKIIEGYPIQPKKSNTPDGGGAFSFWDILTECHQPTSSFKLFGPP